MAITKGKVLINVEMTVKEREYVRYLARLHGLPMATYARMKMLEAPIEKEAA